MRNPFEIGASIYKEEAKEAKLQNELGFSFAIR
jgi:hypothetical protein